MTETVKITVPKSRVEFIDDWARVDTGLTEKELILALLKYQTSDAEGIAVVRKKEAKE